MIHRVIFGVDSILTHFVSISLLTHWCFNSLYILKKKMPFIVRSVGDKHCSAAPYII